MITNHTVDSMRAFETDIANEYNLAKIRAPVHLSNGNEQQLIDIFRVIEPYDYVATAWRSHYHCLLKGVPPSVLKTDIMAGKSITLNYPDFRVLSSAIVGGILPIAVGIAMAIKRRGGTEQVFCFIGDMTSRTGIASECMLYTQGHSLPIEFIIEDNGVSVCTPTADAWGRDFTDIPFQRYRHQNSWPHSGAGTRINF